MFGFCEFGSGLNSLIIEDSLMYEFGASGLHGKIILCEGYLWFARVTILCNEIASITCQHHIIYLTVSPRAKLDHFPDVGKMVGNRFAGIGAGVFCPFHSIFETLPFRIPENMIEFSGTPAFHTLVFDGNGFETVKQFLYFLRFHKCFILSRVRY